VLERVHHSLASVVIQQQRDRPGHVDLVDIGMELHVVARHVDQEAPDRLPQPGTPERRAVQLSGQGAHALRGPVLRLLDLHQELLGLADLARVEMPPRYVDLDRESEQELREIVVQERRDLHPLVPTFLGHAVR